MKNLTSISSTSLTRSQIVLVRFLPAYENYVGEMYFGSLAAIFEVFTPEELGVDLQTLYAAGLSVDGLRYATEMGVEIEKVVLYRKKQAKPK